MVLLCVLSVRSLAGCRVLLGPEVTFGPPGLDLLGPVVLRVAHCAQLEDKHWSIQLRRRAADSRWEVRDTPHAQCAH